MKTPLHRHAEKGLTLVEVAVCVLILGLTASAAIRLHDTAYRQQQIDITNERIDAIVQALSVYAESAGRIPCPADPSAAGAATFGWEYGVAAASATDPLTIGAAPAAGAAAKGYPAGKCGGAAPTSPTVGILPFMSLGLPPETARDGWGNYFTYAVSPVFAQPNDQTQAPSPPPTGDSGTIHNRCRSQAWIHYTDGVNLNAVKARFCCTDQESAAAAPFYFDQPGDLVIKYETGGVVGNTVSPARTVFGGASADYSADSKGINTMIYTPAASTPPAAGTMPAVDASPIEAPAFVLVSHGPDGLGAYLPTPGVIQQYGTPAAGAEAENANGDQTFVEGPWNMSSTGNHFDNIVRWLTQDGLMAAHGALSCSYP